MGRPSYVGHVVATFCDVGVGNVHLRVQTHITEAADLSSNAQDRG